MDVIYVHIVFSIASRKSATYVFSIASRKSATYAYNFTLFVQFLFDTSYF